jgi:hypothetical protein
VAETLGHPPSRSEFISETGISEFKILKHFPGWSQAVRASGLEPDSTNVRLDDSVLLEDWGKLIRRDRRIPTRHQYRREGRFSPGAFEKHFGPWSAIPDHFRSFAKDRPDWADVVALLPVPRLGAAARTAPIGNQTTRPAAPLFSVLTGHRHPKLDGLPTYGDPIDFRGMRHEPVNEQGVVFLFGMVARELGYLVEAVQTGYPDCEAKRQIGPGKWQRVRIEFEFESRNFRDHGHPQDGCDLIVCWKDNWADRPNSIEVLELETMIPTLAADDDA